MRIDLVAVGALAGLVGSAGSVRTAASCSVAALTALQVPDVSVADAQKMILYHGASDPSIPAPEAIEASTRPESAMRHRLPLCPYPKQARYGGTGQVSDRANWSCAARGGE